MVPNQATRMASFIVADRPVWPPVRKNSPCVASSTDITGLNAMYTSRYAAVYWPLICGSAYLARTALSMSV
jgi:hypothetical protein